MFEVDKSASTGWMKPQGRGESVPRSVDMTCPYCNRPNAHFTFMHWDAGHGSMMAFARCSGCNEQARFWVIDPPINDTEQEQEKSRFFVYPAPSLNETFDEGIENVSPTFVKIYNQALAAERFGLDLLNGIGYRKAIEFLIKDYLYHKLPDKRDEILNKQLWPCIQEYVDDPRLQECARMATWLGNNETHYVRKWKDKDINDLKVLLKLTIYWISSELLTEKYRSSMSRK